MLSSPIPVLVMKAVESPLEFKIPISIRSRSCKTIETQALLDCGSGATFIDKNFVLKHGITQKKLPSLLNLRTVDGSPSKAGSVTHYCLLYVKIDQWNILGKFNITQLGKDDNILGLPFFPYIKQTKGAIDLIEKTISLPANRHSQYIDSQLAKNLPMKEPPVKPDDLLDLWTQ